MKTKNNIVKILVDNNGERKIKPKWCLIDPCSKQGRATLCTREFFGEAESGCVYEQKFGNITCDKCIEIINTYKKIKL